METWEEIENLSKKSLQMVERHRAENDRIGGIFHEENDLVYQKQINHYQETLNSLKRISI